MIPTLSITVRCAHPKCEAALVLDAGSYGSARDRPRNLPDDWYWHSAELQACPAHAPEAKGAATAAYEWAVKRTDAYNKVMRELRRAHPVPRHPAWLDTIWKERDRDL